MTYDFVVDAAFGSDANPGTELAPFRTFARLLLEPSLGPGSIVGLVDDSESVESVDWTRSGAFGAPLRIVRIGGGAGFAPKIDGGTNPFAWRFHNCAYVQLEGVELFGGRNTVVWTNAVACKVVRVDAHHPQQDGGAPTTTGRCFVFGDASTHDVEVRDCVVRDAPNDGAYAAGAFQLVFEGTAFRDIGDKTVANDACGLRMDGSLYVKVHACTFARCYGLAGLLIKDLSYAVVSRAWFVDCYRDSVRVDGSSIAGVASSIIWMPDDMATDVAAEGVNGVHALDGATAIVAGCTAVNGWSGTLAGTGACSFKNVASNVAAYGCISQCLTDQAAHWYLDLAAVGMAAAGSVYWPDDTTADLSSGRFRTSLIDGQFAAWQLVPVAVPTFVVDPDGIVANPLLVDVDAVGENPLAALLTEGSPARGRAPNLTGFFLAYGVVPEDFTGRLRAPTGTWDSGAADFVYQPASPGSDLVFRTNRVGAGLRFGVTATMRAGLAFSTGYADVRAGETLVPPVIGYRIYRETEIYAPPPFRRAVADGVVSFSDRLDPAMRYVCDVEVLRLATAVRPDRSVPLTTERYREEPAPSRPEERGSFGRFCETTSLVVSAGALITRIADPRPVLQALIIGDDLLETATERPGYDTFDEAGALRPAGWRDNFLVRGLETALAALAPARRLVSVNLTDASFSLTNLSFPRGVGGALYASAAAFRAGVGTRPDVDGETFREPFWSWPGAAVDYATRLAEARDVAAFAPEIAVIALGRRDQEYADAYDPGWPDAVRTGLLGLVSAVRTQWPACRIVVVAPHCPGPFGRYDPGGSRVDLVDEAISRAVVELAQAPYTISGSDLLAVSLSQLAADAGPGFGTIGRTLSADQHGMLATAFADELTMFLLPYDQDLPAAVMNSATNSQYEAAL